MSLVLVPITIKDARAFVRRFHRHHDPPHKCRFAVACARENAEEPCGVSIIGDPVSRLLDTGWTAEVLRCATDGTPNACSMLYGASWRAARALGYRRLVTYTLSTEPGTSLRASGWKSIGECGGGSWDRPSRPRVDHYPTQIKIKWEATA